MRKLLAQFGEVTTKHAIELETISAVDPRYAMS
jgi:hypothetical protein